MLFPHTLPDRAPLLGPQPIPAQLRAARTTACQCCTPPRTPHPSLLGGGPRGDAEAPSFGHPGLRRGEKRMCRES